MSTAQVKSQLHEYINKADEKLLRLMHSILQNYFKEEDSIIAFTASGVPITKGQMKELSDEAVKAVEDGQSLSSDEIRKLKNNW